MAEAVSRELARTPVSALVDQFQNGMVLQDHQASNGYRSAMNRSRSPGRELDSQVPSMPLPMPMQMPTQMQVRLFNYFFKTITSLSKYDLTPCNNVYQTKIQPTILNLPLRYCFLYFIYIIVFLRFFLPNSLFAGLLF